MLFEKVNIADRIHHGYNVQFLQVLLSLTTRALQLLFRISSVLRCSVAAETGGDSTFKDSHEIPMQNTLFRN
jgi:hypothetical protein